LDVPWKLTKAINKLRNSGFTFVGNSVFLKLKQLDFSPVRIQYTS